MVFVDLYETNFFLWQIIQLLNLILSSHTFSVIDNSEKTISMWKYILKHIIKKLLAQKRQ